MRQVITKIEMCISGHLAPKTTITKSHHYRNNTYILSELYFNAGFYTYLQQFYAKGETNVLHIVNFKFFSLT